MMTTGLSVFADLAGVQTGLQQTRDQLDQLRAKLGALGAAMTELKGKIEGLRPAGPPPPPPPRKTPIQEFNEGVAAGIPPTAEVVVGVAEYLHEKAVKPVTQARARKFVAILKGEAKSLDDRRPGFVEQQWDTAFKGLCWQLFDAGHLETLDSFVTQLAAHAKSIKEFGDSVVPMITGITEAGLRVSSFFTQFQGTVNQIRDEDAWKLRKHLDGIEFATARARNRGWRARCGFE